MTDFPKAARRKLPRYRVPLQQPVTEGGVIEMPAGDFIQIANGAPVRFVAHLEFRADAGASRGSHYHLARTEWLTVIRGRLLARLRDLDTGERVEWTLEAGDQVTMYPRCAHTYAPLEDAAAVEVASLPFDPADTVPFAF